MPPSKASATDAEYHAKITELCGDQTPQANNQNQLLQAAYNNGVIMAKPRAYNAIAAGPAVKKLQRPVLTWKTGKLTFSRKQMRSFRRYEAASSPSPSPTPSSAAPSVDNTPEALRPAIILRMWNGSRIAGYKRETLALRCNGKVHKHVMSKARFVRIE